MKIKVKLQKVSTILSMLMLAGCLSPVKVKPQTAYVINKVPSVAVKRTHHETLLVLKPEASAAYDTTQMAYSINPYQIAYFSQNRWAETPSEMLQPLIVQTLQNTHYYRAVVTPPFIGQYDYVLSTEILRLQQDFTHQPSMIQLTVRAQITKVATNRVIATKEFSIHMPAYQRSPYGGVYAANHATAEFLRQLAAFCTHVRA